MNLYLDDDSIEALLVQMLRLAGRDVVIPANFGQSGAHDPVHLWVALLDQRTLLTRNNRDFEELHELIRDSGGHHSGVFVVCRENDPTRDMKVAQIVRAIAKLEAARVPIADELIVLNHWR